MYLSEYASPRTRRRLKPVLETLGRVPQRGAWVTSTLQVINPSIVQDTDGEDEQLDRGSWRQESVWGESRIPLVASVAEDAMYAVPNALREAAYGIGTRRRTVTASGSSSRRPSPASWRP